jgi:hypothetical protein
MESPENYEAVFQPSRKPWKSIKPIPTFPPPRQLRDKYENIPKGATRRCPPQRTLQAHFRIGKDCTTLFRRKSRHYNRSCPAPLPPLPWARKILPAALQFALFGFISFVASPSINFIFICAATTAMELILCSALRERPAQLIPAYNFQCSCRRGLVAAGARYRTTLG